MVEIVDPELLKRLCLKHQVPFNLAKKVISDFSLLEGSKKSYVRDIIEEWNEIVGKKADT